MVDTISLYTVRCKYCGDNLKMGSIAKKLNFIHLNVDFDFRGSKIGFYGKRA